MVTPSHAADRLMHPGMTDALVLEGQLLQEAGVHSSEFVTSSRDDVHAAVQDVAPGVVAPSEEV